jgi:outer membrane protein assembly factor BamB
VQLTPTRRRLLAMLAAPVLLPRPARAGPDNVVARWPTGDSGLVPATRVETRLVVAGETLLGVLDLTVSGRSIWLRPHGLGSRAAFRPRIADGVIVCGAGNALAAFTAADGAPLWRRQADIQIGVPTLADGRAVFGDGHQIVAADLGTGRDLWRFTTTPDTLAAYAPAVAAGAVFAGPGDGRLYKLAGDGRLVWRIDLADEWQYLRQLHVDGAMLVAGSYKERLYGIDAETGAVAWRFAAGNFINSHVVAEGLACLWSPTGWVFALDARTGLERWRHRTTDYGDHADNWAPVMAELAVAFGSLHVLAMNHVLHVLDLATGVQTGRLRLSEPVRPFVVIEDAGTALVATLEGEIVRVTIG